MNEHDILLIEEAMRDAEYAQAEYAQAQAQQPYYDTTPVEDPGALLQESIALGQAEQADQPMYYAPEPEPIPEWGETGAHGERWNNHQGVWVAQDGATYDPNEGVWRNVPQATGPAQQAELSEWGETGAHGERWNNRRKVWIAQDGATYNPDEGFWRSPEGEPRGREAFNFQRIHEGDGDVGALLQESIALGQATQDQQPRFYGGAPAEPSGFDPEYIRNQRDRFRNYPDNYATDMAMNRQWDDRIRPEVNPQVMLNAAKDMAEKAGIPLGIFDLADYWDHKGEVGAWWFTPEGEQYRTDAAIEGPLIGGQGGRVGPGGDLSRMSEYVPLHEAIHAFENALTPEERAELNQLIQDLPLPDGEPTRHHPPQDEHASGITAYFDYQFGPWWQEDDNREFVLGEKVPQVPTEIRSFINQVMQRIEEEPRPIGSPDEQEPLGTRTSIVSEQRGHGTPWIEISREREELISDVLEAGGYGIDGSDGPRGIGGSGTATSQSTGVGSVDGRSAREQIMPTEAFMHVSRFLGMNNALVGTLEGAADRAKQSLQAQGFEIDATGNVVLPEGADPDSPEIQQRIIESVLGAFDLSVLRDVYSKEQTLAATAAGEMAALQTPDSTPFDIDRQAPAGSLRDIGLETGAIRGDYSSVVQGMKNPETLALLATGFLGPGLIGGSRIGLTASKYVLAPAAASSAIQRWEGFDTLPEPVQRTLEIAPFFVAGPGSAALKAASLLGAVAGGYGSEAAGGSRLAGEIAGGIGTWVFGPKALRTAMNIGSDFAQNRSVKATVSGLMKGDDNYFRVFGDHANDARRILDSFTHLPAAEKTARAREVVSNYLGGGLPISRWVANTREGLAHAIRDESGAFRIPELPQALRGAKPNYSYGQKRFTLEFANDLDRAAYITAGAKPSKRDADYLKFVMDNTGMTADEVRAAGRMLRDDIKQMASEANPGGLLVPPRLGGSPDRTTIVNAARRHLADDGLDPNAIDDLTAFARGADAAPPAAGTPRGQAWPEMEEAAARERLANALGVASDATPPHPAGAGSTPAPPANLRPENAPPSKGRPKRPKENTPIYIEGMEHLHQAGPARNTSLQQAIDGINKFKMTVEDAVALARAHAVDTSGAKTVDDVLVRMRSAMDEAPLGLPRASMLDSMEAVRQSIHEMDNFWKKAAEAGGFVPILNKAITFMNPSALTGTPPQGWVNMLGRDRAVRLQETFLALQRRELADSVHVAAVEDIVRQKVRRTGFEIKDGYVTGFRRPVVPGGPTRHHPLKEPVEIDEFFQNYFKYRNQVPKEARGTVTELKRVLDDMNLVEKRAGVHKDELFFEDGFYFPRHSRATGPRTGAKKVGAEQGFQQNRLNDTLQEMRLSGRVPEDDLAVLIGGRIRAGLRATRDHEVQAMLKPLRDAHPTKQFPAAIEDVVKQHFQPLPINAPIDNSITWVNSLLKTQNAVLDMSHWTLQMYATLSTNPAAFAKGIAYSMDGVISDSRLYGKYLEANSKHLERFISKNLMLRGQDYSMRDVAQGKIQRYISQHGVKTRFGDIPTSGSVIGRFSNAFDNSLNVVALENAKAIAGIGEAMGPSFIHRSLTRIMNLGMDPYSGQDIDAVAASVANKMTGRMPAAALGVSGAQRSLEGNLLFASNYYRASFGMLADAVQGGMRGAEGRRVLGSMMASSAAFYYGATQALGQEAYWDPSDSKFMTVRVTDPISGTETRIGIGGPINGIIRTIGALRDDPSLLKNVSLNPDSDDFFMKNPAARFLRYRTSPLIRILTDTVIVGQDAMGRDASSSLEDIGFYLGKQTLPFSVQNALQGEIEGAGVGQGAYSALGIRAWPESSSTILNEKFQNEVIPSLIEQGRLPESMLGKDRSELTTPQIKMAEQYLRDTEDTETLDRWQSDRERRGNIIVETGNRAEAAREEVLPAFDKLMDDLYAGRDPNEIWRDMNREKHILEGRTGEIYDDPDYRRIIDGLDTSDIRRMEDEYFSITRDTIAARPVGGSMDDVWEKIEKKQAEFMEDLEKSDPELYEQFVNSMELRSEFSTKFPIEILRNELYEKLQPFYQMADEGVENRERYQWLRENPDADVANWMLHGSTVNSVDAAAQAKETIPNRPVELYVGGQQGSLMVTPENLPILQQFNHQVNELVTMDATPYQNEEGRTVYPRTLIRQQDPLYDALYFWLGMSSPDDDNTAVVYNPEAVYGYIEQWGPRQDGARPRMSGDKEAAPKPAVLVTPEDAGARPAPRGYGIDGPDGPAARMERGDPAVAPAGQEPMVRAEDGTIVPESQPVATTTGGGQAPSSGGGRSPSTPRGTQPSTPRGRGQSQDRFTGRTGTVWVDNPADAAAALAGSPNAEIRYRFDRFTNIPVKDYMIPTLQAQSNNILHLRTMDTADNARVNLRANDPLFDALWFWAGFGDVVYNLDEVNKYLEEWGPRFDGQAPRLSNSPPDFPRRSDSASRPSTGGRTEAAPGPSVGRSGTGPSPASPSNQPTTRTPRTQGRLVQQAVSQIPRFSDPADREPYNPIHFVNMMMVEAKDAEEHRELMEIHVAYQYGTLTREGVANAERRLNERLEAVGQDRRNVRDEEAIAWLLLLRELNQREPDDLHDRGREMREQQAEAAAASAQAPAPPPQATQTPPPAAQPAPQVQPMPTPTQAPPPPSRPASSTPYGIDGPDGPAARMVQEPPPLGYGIDGPDGPAARMQPETRPRPQRYGIDGPDGPAARQEAAVERYLMEAMRTGNPDNELLEQIPGHMRDEIYLQAIIMLQEQMEVMGV